MVLDAGTWRVLRKAERYEDAGEDATANTRRFAGTIDNTDKTRRLVDARAPGGPLEPFSRQEGGWVGGGAWDGEVATHPRGNTGAN